MSGPKVVRIVTREELLAECRTALARLDNAAGAWTAQGRDAAAVAATQARRDAFAAALTDSNLAGVAARIDAETAYLRDAIGQQRRAVAEAKAVALQQARQLRANAQALLRELAAKGLGDAPLDTALRRVQAGECDSGEAERIVREAIGKLVATPPEPALTGQQRRIAERLRADEAAADHPVWQAPADPREQRLQRIEQRLAELAGLLGDPLAGTFAQRLRALESTPADARGNLLADSLIADLQAAVEQARQTAALTTAAQDLLVEIESAGAADSLSAPVGALRLAVTAAAAPPLRDALAAAEAAWKAHRVRQAAQARRAAILGGLAALGYEVHEGMHTALAAQGRIVLRKPALAGFGVEIAGAGDAARLQVRAVAFEPSRDSRRDRDAETVWCADFHRLEAMLAQQGDGVAVEKALAIGAAPLKVVAAETQVEPASRTNRQT